MMAMALKMMTIVGAKGATATTRTRIEGLARVLCKRVRKSKVNNSRHKEAQYPLKV